jgi:hypothetical protein
MAVGSPAPEQQTEAEAVLAEALPAAFPFADWGDDRLRRDAAGTLVDELRERGWELVRIDG